MITISGKVDAQFTVNFTPSCLAAAYGLLQKKSRLFSINSNNAVLEFFIEGAPEIVETHLDSKKVNCKFMSDAICKDS